MGIPVVVALNKSDINEKKNTKIDEKALSEILGCPVIKTISTSADGLKDVVGAAVSLAGKSQKAPYTQENINLADKKEVEASDRKRFAFVNKVVKKVEVRKTLMKEKSKDDAIDKIITHPVVGIAVILLGALMIKQITGMKYRKNFFIMELPEYKVPSLVFACKSMLERGKAYIIKAGTIILVCNTVVKVMATFTPSFAVAAEDSSDSILSVIASPFAVLVVPIVGFACWQCAAAAITGLTKAAALAYLMFNLFTPPCFAALGAMNAEMKSGKWLAGAIGFQLATGYTIGFVVYQVGTLITTGTFGAGFVGGLIAIILIAAFISYLCVNANKKVKEEYALNAKA